MKNIIFINSHPIQYFAPMYKYMNEQGVTTKAWYCSDESIKGGFDKQFGTEIKWDIPLLEGYDCRFFKNNSLHPSHSNGFFGLVNFGMITALFKIPQSVIIVHGWHYFTHLFILLFGKLAGHTICLRCDVPYIQEQLKKGWKQTLKKAGLRYLLFPRISFFLYVGNQNKLFYQDYGVSDSRLLFCPYAVDNERFQNECLLLQTKKTGIRQIYQIPVADKIILFTAKYIDKKRPLDLIKAFSQLPGSQNWLILVGEGELRKEMEAYIRNNNITRVILTGFVNQSKIAEFYAIGDVFVMCSGEGENWGLSVNEAMNFQLPVIVSTLTGCSDDLVREGQNGYIFPAGNVEALIQALRKILQQDKAELGSISRSIIDRYSFSIIVQEIKAIL